MPNHNSSEKVENNIQIANDRFASQAAPPLDITPTAAFGSEVVIQTRVNADLVGVLPRHRSLQDVALQRFVYVGSKWRNSVWSDWLFNELLINFLCFTYFLFSANSPFLSLASVIMA